MYGLYDDMKLFTDREQLYSKVSNAKLLDIIRQKRVKVVSSYRGHNSYGEFRFVTVTVPRRYPGQASFREAVTFYGNGYHEYRETTPASWSFSVGNSCLYNDKPAMNKRSVIAEIELERREMSFDDQPRDNLFTILADIGDEDSALLEVWGC